MILFLVLLVLLCYALFEYSWFRVVRLNKSNFTDKVYTHKGKRLVFLTDFQYDHKFMGFYHRPVKKLMASIRELNPDIILLGGDFIHRDTDSAYLIFDYLESLDVPMFAILGNHDYKNVNRVLASCMHAGITVLRDECLVYEGINIVGLDKTWEEDHVLIDFDTSLFTVVLSHSPDFLVKHKVQGDIMLAGHLHGGQISFLGLFSPITNSAYGQKYLHGLKSIEASKLYISSGLGGFVYYFPIRFFARPEIVIIDL